MENGEVGYLFPSARTPVEREPKQDGDTVTIQDQVMAAIHVQEVLPMSSLVI